MGDSGFRHGHGHLFTECDDQVRFPLHLGRGGGIVSPSHVLLIIVIAKTLKKSFVVQDLEIAILLFPL